jgi:hypothetical protein
LSQTKTTENDAVEKVPSNIGQANGLLPRPVGSKDSHRERASQEYRRARVPEAVVLSSYLGEDGIGCIPADIAIGDIEFDLEEWC